MVTGFYAGVVIETISPSYYASAQSVREAHLYGQKMFNLPSDAVGIRSNSNDDPLVQLYMTGERYTYELQVVNDNEIVAALAVDASSSQPTYFSAIVSRDRTRVYWQNETKPIP